MSAVILDAAAHPDATPVHALREDALAAWLAAADPVVAAFAGLSEFKARAGQLVVVPSSEGRLGQVLFGLGKGGDAMTFRQLPTRLPAGQVHHTARQCLRCQPIA